MTHFPAASKPSSPSLILAITIVGVFLSEVLAMIVLYFLNGYPYWFLSILDGLMTATVVFPLVYYFSFRSLVMNIHERRRSETLLRNVLESMPVGVWITDDQGTIVYGNPASQQIWQGARFVDSDHYGQYKGWRPDSGRPIQPDEWPILRALQHKETTLDEEVEIECFDGAHKIILNSVKPILDEHQNLLGAIVVNQDITQRWQAEKQLEQQNLELRKLSQAEQEQRRLAETLSDVSLSITQSLDLETVMDTLLEGIRRLVVYDCASVFLSEDEDRLAVRASLCYRPEDSSAPELHTVFDVWDYPFVQAVIAGQHSLRIDDVDQYSGWKSGLYGGRHGAAVRSWLGIPMQVGGKVIGIIALAGVEPQAFSPQQVRLAEAISAQVSVAVQNAWLFEQVRAGHERLQSLSHRLVEVQESERRYISRELHDETSQALTSIMLGLRLLEREAGRPAELRRRIAELMGATTQVLENLHRLAVNLRPVSLDHLGLAPALQQLIDDMARRYELNVRFKSLGFANGERLPGNIETNLYRIVQEALNNACRHAAAETIDVILEQRDGQIVAIIEDDGGGFDHDALQKSGHLGLVGMQERAQMMAGGLQVESSLGAGTTIIVEVPYAG